MKGLYIKAHVQGDNYNIGDELYVKPIYNSIHNRRIIFYKVLSTETGITLFTITAQEFVNRFNAINNKGGTK